METKDVLAKGRLKFPEDRNIIFKKKQDVCNLFGVIAVKRGYQEQSYFKLENNVSIWFVQEHSDFVNGFKNVIYPDFIKEIREEKSLEFVQSALNNQEDYRYVFLKISNGYTFWGAYKLDVERSINSLESKEPTRFWNKVSDEMIFTK